MLDLPFPHSRNGQKKGLKGFPTNDCFWVGGRSNWCTLCLSSCRTVDILPGQNIVVGGENRWKYSSFVSLLQGWPKESCLSDGANFLQSAEDCPMELSYTTGVQLANYQVNHIPYTLTCPPHFEPTKVNYEFFPKADGASSFVSWRLLSHNTPRHKPGQATQQPSDILHCIWMISPDLNKILYTWRGCWFQQCHPAGSVDFFRVWWRRDCHQSSFTSRREVEQNESGTNGKVEGQVPESPGDSDTFIWMEHRRRESQLKRYWEGIAFLAFCWISYDILRGDAMESHDSGPGAAANSEEVQMFFNVMQPQIGKVKYHVKCF